MKRTEKSVPDEAAIYFTKSFYQKLFDQKDICTAYKEAKSETASNFKDHEANLFKLFLK